VYKHLSIHFFHKGIFYLGGGGAGLQDKKAVEEVLKAGMLQVHSTAAQMLLASAIVTDVSFSLWC